MNDIEFSVNGQSVTAPANLSSLPLLDFLQEELGLTGTKFGCGIGVCRACTVALRRRAEAPLEVLLSCSTPLTEVAGLEVFTIEGVAKDGKLHPLQMAILEGFAFQCGYCTPGFVMAAFELWDRLKSAPVPLRALDETIRKALGGHVCRCTGYLKYYAAVRKVILDEGGLVK